MNETVLEILRWILTTGVGAVIGWFMNRSVTKAQQAREIHQAYKEMYEDVSKELIKIRNENDEYRQRADNATEALRRAVNRLSRAVEAIKLCDYRTQCPIPAELRIDEEDGNSGGGHEERHTPGGRRKGVGGKRPGGTGSGHRHDDPVCRSNGDAA